MKTKFWFLIVFFLGILVMPWIQTAQATPITATKLNSTLTFDEDTGLLYSWVVDTVEMINQIVYYYRLGDGREFLLNASTLLDQTTIFPGFFVQFGYQSDDFIDGVAGWQVTLTHFLTGFSVGSKKSMLGQSVKMKNYTDEDFYLFEVNDLQLGGNDADDTVKSTGSTGTDFLGFDSRYVFEESLTNAGGAIYAHQADLATVFINAGSGLLDDSDKDDDLDTSPSSPTGSASGNVAFGFQFQVTADEDFDDFSKIIQITPNHTPEPSSLLLFGCGLLGMAVFVWRRKRSQKA